MLGAPGFHRRRRVPSTLVGAALAASLAFTVACGTDREGLQAADNAAIGIETSQLAVALQNRAGAPLVDLTVSVVTPGLTFTKTITRMENAERRELSLNDFSSRDGTTLNLRFVRPTAVKVTATDVANKKYDIQTRWR